MNGVKPLGLGQGQAQQAQGADPEAGLFDSVEDLVTDLERALAAS